MEQIKKDEINYDELEFLRANTILNPFAYVSVLMAKRHADEYRNWYLENEGELLESDYAIADKIEYDLRFQNWKNKCASMWRQYSDGLDLDEFSRMVIHDSLNNENNRKR